MSVWSAEDTLPDAVANELLARHRPSTLVAEWAATSVRGTARSNNEDACGERRSRVFVVADGIGGRPGGELASATVVAELLSRLSVDANRPPWAEVIAATNTAVLASAAAAGHARIGAAAAAVCVADRRVTVIHLGDVRVYRLRNGDATLLTNDHNIAREIAAARIDPADLDLRPAALRALTVYFGDSESARGFGVRNVNVKAHDVLVLCSDGVHGRLTAQQWGNVAHHHRPSEIAVELVRAARLAGATDDATALVVRFGPQPEAE